MSDNFRWNGEFIRRLVVERNTDENKKLFKNKKGKEFLINDKWNEIASFVEPNCSGAKAADKYSKLFCKYITELHNCSKTGAAPSAWPYYDLFREYVPEGAKEAPAVRVEAGGEKTQLVYTKSEESQ